QKKKKATFYTFYYYLHIFYFPKQIRRRRPNEDAHSSTSLTRYHLLSLCYHLFIIIFPIVNITSIDTS
uniref:Uncharacterized protein n=1 Tax=Wuchereria bancrofti TaxID=6293 RepID=A0A1I8EC43_WUCBA